MTAARVSPQELAALADFVDDRMGLHFPSGKWADLSRALEAAAPRAGFAASTGLVAAILTGSATTEQITHFENCLTINETYFFRDPKSFAALERHILPELARAHPGSIRIWSAGCSDGAEPYSIAIACRRALALSGAVNVSILATDIDRAALALAGAATYTKWSFRETPESFTRDYFTTVASGRWELRSEIREMVRFARHNLVSRERSMLAETSNMDVIFCRNTLMYFSPDQLRVAADRLQDSLAIGGHLFVAPSEATRILFPRLKLVRVAGAFCYTKPGPGALTAAVPSKPPTGRVRLDAEVKPPRGIARPVDLAPTVAVPTVAQAKALADRGRLAEALAVCDEIAPDMKATAPYHFMRATILQELGRPEDAAAELRRVLYLEPDFALAHLLLGNDALRAGDPRAAARHHATLAKILAGLPPEAVLPETDGMTVGEVRAMMSHITGGS